jgi:hypothetical protein
MKELLFDVSNVPILKNTPLHSIFYLLYFCKYFPRKLFFFEFGLMYCEYTKVRKLFKGGNYLRKYGSFPYYSHKKDAANFVHHLRITSHSGAASIQKFDVTELGCD